MGRGDAGEFASFCVDSTHAYFRASSRSIVGGFHCVCVCWYWDLCDMLLLRLNGVRGLSGKLSYVGGWVVCKSPVVSRRGMLCLQRGEVTG